MAEEARLKNGTVTRMDYLGVASESNTPVLLIEAKAWDKPFITRRVRGRNTSYDFATVIAQAIYHWRSAGDRKKSPAAPEWHDYLEQVGGYVCGHLDVHEHELPRAVVTSGQWLVVFKRPARRLASWMACSRLRPFALSSRFSSAQRKCRTTSRPTPSLIASMRFISATKLAGRNCSRRARAS